MLWGAARYSDRDGGDLLKIVDEGHGILGEDDAASVVVPEEKLVVLHHRAKAGRPSSASARHDFERVRSGLKSGDATGNVGGHFALLRVASREVAAMVDCVVVFDFCMRPLLARTS